MLTAGVAAMSAAGAVTANLLSFLFYQLFMDRVGSNEQMQPLKLLQL